MIELLKLCGIEGQELEVQLPRIKKAFGKLGITGVDIERGKERLNRYYDIELLGVRKALRLCLQEMVDAALAREERKKVLYGFMSTQFGWVIGPALVNRSSQVYAAAIDMLFPFIFGCIFGKMIPVLEAAEQKWLKSGGVTHCGNLKSITGIFVLGLLPKPDLLVASGFNCDTAPKTLNMLNYFYDIPVYHFSPCQDQVTGEPPDTRNADFAEKSLKRLVERVQDVVGFEISDDMLLEAMKDRKSICDALDRLSHLVSGSDPLLLRPATDIIWTVLFELALSNKRMPEAIAAINTVHEELQERAGKGMGVLPKGAPRIIAPLPMHQSEPALEHLVYELGIALVPSPFSGPPPFPAIEKGGNPYVLMSGGNRPPMDTSLRTKMHAYVEVCKAMKIDGLLDRYHAGCRMTVGEAMVIKEVVEKDAGIPVLMLEWETFDPRIHNHEEYRRRLEVFKAMMLK